MCSPTDFNSFGSFNYYENNDFGFAPNPAPFFQQEEGNPDTDSLTVQDPSQNIQSLINQAHVQFNYNHLPSVPSEVSISALAKQYAKKILNEEAISDQEIAKVKQSLCQFKSKIKIEIKKNIIGVLLDRFLAYNFAKFTDFIYYDTNPQPIVFEFIGNNSYYTPAGIAGFYFQMLIELIHCEDSKIVLLNNFIRKFENFWGSMQIIDQTGKIHNNDNFNFFHSVDEIENRCLNYELINQIDSISDKLYKKILLKIVLSPNSFARELNLF